MLAMTLQTLAAGGLLQALAHGRPVGFHSEICTATGLINLTDGTAPDSSGKHAGSHECCTACALSAPLLGSTRPRAVPPAPTFAHVAEMQKAAFAAPPLYLLPPSRAPPQA